MNLKAWIPNAMSLGNLGLGFLSILICIRSGSGTGYQPADLFFVSSLLILFAAFLDGLDGMVARWLNVDSPLGKQLDSLADLTTFGIAPGALIYTMYLQHLPPSINFYDIPLVSVVVAVVYPISAAFRLARFNVESPKDSFIGLPSPIAGIALAFVGLLFPVYELNVLPAILLYILLAVLMSSNIRYAKPQVQFREHLTRFKILALMLGFGVATYFMGWRLTILMCLLFYISSGIVVLLIHLLQKIKVVFGK